MNASRPDPSFAEESLDLPFGMAPEDLDGLDDDALKSLRLNELPVRIEGSWIEGVVHQLYDELSARGQTFHPPCYVSTEWFVDKGETSIAVPFYLLHPRLLRLEKKQVLDVEGGTTESSLKILRHEAGHAFDFAFDIHARSDRRELFGKSSTRYPDHYIPKPHSKSFVRHLDNWYAQSHPDEDFAETFAVWLKPDSDWQTKYKRWPGARRKLEWVSKTLDELATKPPPRPSKKRPYALGTLEETLREFYDERLSTLEEAAKPEVVDTDLHRLFAPKEKAPTGEPAHRFLKRHQKSLREVIAKWAVFKKYNADRLLRDMILRCEELDLRCHLDEQTTLIHLAACSVALSKNHLFAGRFSMSS